MNVRRVMPIVVLFAALGSPGTTAAPVTNRTAIAPNHRVVGKRTYDASTSLEWKTISFNPDAQCSFYGRFPGPEQTGKFSAYIKNNFRVDVLHFPYHVGDFTVAPQGAFRLRPNGTKYYRVFPISAKTNWLAGGKISSIQMTFDYGIPATNAVSTVVPTQ